MVDELRPGVDRPKRWQYAVAAVIIIALAGVAYWMLRARGRA
jgi:hypothetical protein